ncbi:MAG: tetratricopeptide repeat protein [Chthoniobacterales bacterium]
MLRPLTFIFLLAAGVTMLAAADPSEQFLSAYQGYQQGEKLERSGNTAEAVKKYRFAESLLVSIGKNDPTWQKPVVEYRLKKIRESLDRLQASGTDAGSAAPSEQASDVMTPEEHPPVPSITITPPSAPQRTATQAPADSSGDVRRLKRQLEELKGELKEAKEALISQKTRSKDLEDAQRTEKFSELTNKLDVANRTISDLKRDLKARASWEKDLKDLQKKLDDTVADKLAVEEQYQVGAKKAAEENAALVAQLREAREKVAGGEDARQKYEQLKKEVESGRESMEQQRLKLEHAEQVAKESGSRSGDLEKKLRQATEKLAAVQKQADETAPLRERLKELQSGFSRSEALAKNSVADLQVAEEERAVLVEKIARLSEAAREASKVKGLEEEGEEFRKTIARLQERAGSAEKELARSRSEAQSSAKAEQDAKERLAKIERNGEADRAALEEERTRLLSKLDQSAKALEAAAKEAGAVAPLNREIAELKARMAENSKSLEVSKNKIAEAEKRAATARAEGEQDAKERLAKIERNGEADRAALEEERTRLLSKLDQSAKALEAAAKEAGAVAPLNREIAELKARMAENSKSLEVSKNKIAEAEKSAATARAEAERKAVASKNLQELLQQQNGSLQEQLKTTLGRISLMVDQGQDASGLREQLTNLQHQIDLNARNHEESQRRIAELSRAQPEQEKALKQKEKALSEARLETEKLQSELAEANQKIVSIQKQGSVGDDRLRELQDQLASRDAEIVELRKGRDASDQKNIEETTLLRGIVLREIKEEARRAQARRLMEEELKRLNVESQTLADQITVLSVPTVKLTPEERALFKDQQLVISDDGGGKMEVSIAAPIQKSIPQDESKNAAKELQKKGDKAAGVVTNPAADQAGEKAAATSSGQLEQGADKGDSSAPADAAAPWQGQFKELLARAKDEFERQDYLQAESTFREALKLNPDDYFALSNLGVVEFQLGRLKEAEEVLRKASEKTSDSSFALTTLGIVHYRQERLSDAEKVLRKSVTVNQEDFTAHNYLGIVLAASGKGKAGESEIMKAIEINPRYADAHFNLAVIYATGKPPAKMMARKHYAKAVELGAPPDPSLENLMK